MRILVCFNFSILLEVLFLQKKKEKHDEDTIYYLFFEDSNTGKQLGTLFIWHGTLDSSTSSFCNLQGLHAACTVQHSTSIPCMDLGLVW